MTSGAEFKKLHELLGPDFRLSITEAQKLHEQAEILTFEGKFIEASELLKQALQISERTLGGTNRDVLNILATMAVTYIALGDFDRATPLLERCFSLAKTTSALEQPVGARVLFYIGAVRIVQGKLAEAETVLKQAMAVAEKFYGQEHFAYAMGLQGLGLLHQMKGDYPEALASIQRGSALMEKVLGPNDPRFAQSLNLVAAIYLYQADYEKAESTCKRSVEIFEKILGLEHLWLAQSLDNLSLIYQGQGKHRQALPVLTRSLAVVQKTMGAESWYAANTLENLGLLHWHLGSYPEALANHRKCLRIRENIFGEDHFLAAQSLNNIGLVLQAQGDLNTALPILERGLAITEKTFGSDNIRLATPLNNLAMAYYGKRDYAEAANLLQRSLEVSQKALGGEHPTVAHVMDNLASVYRDEGQIGKITNVLMLFNRSLEIREKALGTEHPDYATSLDNIGGIFQLARNYKAAIGCFQKSQSIRKTVFGAEHPITYGTQRKLAWAQFYQGDLFDSATSLTYSFLLERRYLLAQFASMAEPDAMRAQEDFFHRADTFQSLCDVCVKSNVLKAQWVGAMQIIVTKASLEEFQVVRAALEADPQTATQVLREQHQSMQFQIAGLSESKLNPIQRDARRRELQEELTRVEAQLAGRVGLVAQTIRERRLAFTDTVESLPLDSALVDFVQYRRFDFFAAKTNQWREERYAAYLTFPLPEGATNFIVERVDLGEATPINEAIAQWHELVSAQRIAPKRIEPVLQRLSELVYAPLARHLTNVSHLIVCPDGQLSRLPFEMLPLPPFGSPPRYLVEEKTISYVGSGREIARLAQPSTKVQTNAPVVIGNPDFDLDLNKAGSSPATSVAAAVTDRRYSTRSHEISTRGLRFAPLPGSEAEARNVAKLLGGDCVLRLGNEAREAELKAVVSPRVLHLATHGFFLTDQELKHTNAMPDLLAANSFATGTMFGTQRGNGTRWNASLPDWENPMVRCGIALAGANHAPQITNAVAEDGLLTGLEASLLNLQGTELVILSACESGTGELKIGEGMMSLRRAFRIAGAETVLASHWKVSDEATQRLMTEFMRRWRGGEPRATAWRAAQLSLLRSPDFSNPYFWAVFTLTGQWR